MRCGKRTVPSNMFYIRSTSPCTSPLCLGSVSVQGGRCFLGEFASCTCFLICTRGHPHTCTISSHTPHPLPLQSPRKVSHCPRPVAVTGLASGDPTHRHSPGSRCGGAGQAPGPTQAGDPGTSRVLPKPPRMLSEAEPGVFKAVGDARARARLAVSLEPARGQNVRRPGRRPREGGEGEWDLAHRTGAQNCPRRSHTASRGRERSGL